MLSTRNVLLALSSAACDDATWELDYVQDAYMRMFHPEKTVLDRINEIE